MYFHFQNDEWKKEDVIELNDAQLFDDFDVEKFFQSFQSEYVKTTYNQELRRIKLNKLMSD